MSRLLHYINESDRDDIFKKLQNNCAPFLRDFIQNRFTGFLYRGVGEYIPDFIRKRVCKDRKPKDTPQKLHEIYGKLFRKHFGWDPRSEGVFALSSSNLASNYGNPYLFFPVGEYEYIWSPNVNDLYDDIDDPYFINMYYSETIISKKQWWRTGGKELPFIEKDDLEDVHDFDFDVKYLHNKYNKQIESFLIKHIDKIVSTYKKTGLKNAIIERNEITFRCKEYFLVNVDYVEDIHHFMYNEFEG